MNRVMRNMFFAMLLSVSSLSVAQEQVQFYPEMSDPLQAVFCDYANNQGEIKYISSRDGQYVGNLIDNKIYGWGYFLANSGAQTIGQYRNGRHFFGVTITMETARVGSENHFVEYDLGTGHIIRVSTPEGELRLGGPYVPTVAAPTPLYTFKKIVYENGDTYYGEMYNGRRHGYGIYYWANGDFWYGKYENGYRQGYGALYKTDHRVFSGKWIGDSKVE